MRSFNAKLKNVKPKRLTYKLTCLPIHPPTHAPTHATTHPPRRTIQGEKVLSETKAIITQVISSSNNPTATGGSRVRRFQGERAIKDRF